MKDHIDTTVLRCASMAMMARSVAHWLRHGTHSEVAAGSLGSAAGAMLARAYELADRGASARDLRVLMISAGLRFDLALLEDKADELEARDAGLLQPGTEVYSGDSHYPTRSKVLAVGLLFADLSESEQRRARIVFGASAPRERYVRLYTVGRRGRNARALTERCYLATHYASPEALAAARARRSA